jgi:hypothetical protein
MKALLLPRTTFVANKSNALMASSSDRHNKTPPSSDGVRVDPELISWRNIEARLRRRYPFVTFPLLMQLVQTLIRLAWPFTSAFTACKFTLQLRRVTLCA